MGASFSNWNDVVDAAYYTGHGAGWALGEHFFLWLSIVLCVVACYWGHTHEQKVNDAGH